MARVDPREHAVRGAALITLADELRKLSYEVTRVGETTPIVPNEVVEVIAAPQTIIFWSGAKADIGAAMVMPVPGAFDPIQTCPSQAGALVSRSPISDRENPGASLQSFGAAVSQNLFVP